MRAGNRARILRHCMNTRFAWQQRLGWLLAAAAMAAFTAGAHTLPISYLRLVPDADYLHLELVFNPFELTFMAEVDENKDGELSPAELQAHGNVMADRVTAAWIVSTDGQRLQAETAGMDPDLNGHHVRLRAHYKVDARRLPLTLESDLISIMNASHLTQVTYGHPEGPQMAQLDSLSRKVTFTPPSSKHQSPPLAPPKALPGMALLAAAVVFLPAAGAGLWLFLRKRNRIPGEARRP